MTLYNVDVNISKSEPDEVTITDTARGKEINEARKFAAFYFRILWRSFINERLKHNSFIYINLSAVAEGHSLNFYDNNSVTVAACIMGESTDTLEVILGKGDRDPLQLHRNSEFFNPFEVQGVAINI